MSKVQNPITGRTKGQAAGMVFTTLYGSNIMKAKPFSYRDANTQVQRDNRGLHIALVRAAASVKTHARSIFFQQPATMSAYAKILSQLQALYVRTSGSPVFTPAAKEIGSGNVEIPSLAATYVAGTGVLTITWDEGDITAPDISNQNVYAIVFDAANKALHYDTSNYSTWNEGSISYTLAAKPAIGQIGVTLAVTNAAAGADLVKNVKRFVVPTV